MLARVSRWEGASPDVVRNTVEAIRREAEERGGPPEGVPAKGLLLLQEPSHGKVVAIALFENEADYEAGDRKLNEMSPPNDLGERVVEKYEVGADLRADEMRG